MKDINKYTEKLAKIILKTKSTEDAYGEMFALGSGSSLYSIVNCLKGIKSIEDLSQCIKHLENNTDDTISYYYNTYKQLDKKEEKENNPINITVNINVKKSENDTKESALKIAKELEGMFEKLKF